MPSDFATIELVDVLHQAKRAAQVVALPTGSIREARRSAGRFGRWWCGGWRPSRWRADYLERSCAPATELEKTYAWIAGQVSRQSVAV